MEMTWEEAARPYRHDGGPVGVVVLHGFTSTPSSVLGVARACANAGHTVLAPLLAGHGTTADDLTTTHWVDWLASARAAVDELARRCTDVFVVGLSLGGALTLQLAEETTLRGVVAINPIVRSPGAEMEQGIAALIDSGVLTIDAIGSDIKIPDVHEHSYDVTPLAQVLEVFDGAESVGRRLGEITCPVLLFSSREDHVVGPENGDLVESTVNGPFRRIWLEDSFHVATLDNERGTIEAAINSFISEVCS